MRSMKKSTVSIQGLTMFIKSPMYNTNNESAVLVTMSQSKLEEMFFRTEERGQVIIADDTGKVQFSYLPDRIGTSLSDSGVLMMANLEGESGSDYIQLADGNYYVNYLRGENGWLYLTVSNAKTIESDMHQMLVIYLITGSGIVAILVTMAILIYKWLYTPILRLTRKTGELENGLKTGGNEFTIIEEGMNSLISQKQMMETQISFFRNGMKELFFIKLIRGFLQEPAEIRKEGQQAGIEENYSAMALLMFHFRQSGKKTQEELVGLMKKIYAVLPLQQIIISTTFQGFWVVWLGECAVCLSFYRKCWKHSVSLRNSFRRGFCYAIAKYLRILRS